MRASLCIRSNLLRAILIITVELALFRDGRSWKREPGATAAVKTSDTKLTEAFPGRICYDKSGGMLPYNQR